VFYFGQVLLTWPVGWIADRMARRAVLVAMSAAALLCMLAMALLARSPAMWALTFLTGGIATGTYTLSLAILGQRFERDTLVSAGAAFLACYALGTVIGPPAVGWLMDRAGSGAFPGALGCTAAAILACAAAGSEWRRAPQLCRAGIPTGATG
jgi:MFS family permease